MTSGTQTSAARPLGNCPLRSSGPASPVSAPSTHTLREERLYLLARYDHHLPPNIFVIVRLLEVEIAWLEYVR